MTSEVISHVRDLTVEDPDLGSRKPVSQIAEELGISISPKLAIQFEKCFISNINCQGNVR
jgi:hypothetical protein